MLHLLEDSLNKNISNFSAQFAYSPYLFTQPFIYFSTDSWVFIHFRL